MVVANELRTEKIKIGIIERINFILKVTIFEIERSLRNLYSKVNNKERNLFILKVSWFKVLEFIYNKYLKFIKFLKRNFAPIQTFITLLITIDMVFILFSENHSPSIFLAAIISIISYILCMLCLSDKLLLKTETSLLSVIFIEFLYFPMYFLSSLLKVHPNPFISNVGVFLFTIFPPVILITALFIAPQVILSSFGQLGFKTFNMPLIMPPTYPVNPVGLNKHMKDIEKILSKLYDTTYYWCVEYFSTACPTENQHNKGALIVSYPSKFKIGKTFPISFYVNGTRELEDTPEIFCESSDFEPKSFSMKLNKDVVSIFFLTPKRTGQTKLMLRLCSSGGNNICGVNLLPSIEKNIIQNAKHGVAGITIIFYTLQILKIFKFI